LQSSDKKPITSQDTSIDSNLSGLCMIAFNWARIAKPAGTQIVGFAILRVSPTLAIRKDGCLAEKNENFVRLAKSRV
jgi:hypothetical protein